MNLYAEGRGQGDFEEGIRQGIRAVLVSPHFLFRIENDPANPPPNRVYRISDLELASRLSFFLWSSIPDDELLDLAADGRLREPGVLEAQVRRMLADERSAALTTSFAAQWLWVRNLDEAVPSEPLFPNFDEPLKRAFRREMELFFDSIVQEDRSVIDLAGRRLHVCQRAAGETLRHPVHRRDGTSGGSSWRRTAPDAACWAKGWCCW